MNLNTQLDRLRETSRTLEDTIQDIDHQMERAMHALAAGADVGHAMTVLNERRNTQLGMMFELGRTTAQIEDIENRLREQVEQPREQQMALAWDALSPTEDHLDWLHSETDGRSMGLIQHDSHHYPDARPRLSDEADFQINEPNNDFDR